MKKTNLRGLRSASVRGLGRSFGLRSLQHESRCIDLFDPDRGALQQHLQRIFWRKRASQPKAGLILHQFGRIDDLQMALRSELIERLAERARFHPKILRR